MRDFFYDIGHSVVVTAFVVLFRNNFSISRWKNVFLLNVCVVSCAFMCVFSSANSSSSLSRKFILLLTVETDRRGLIFYVDIVYLNCEKMDKTNSHKTSNFTELWRLSDDYGQQHKKPQYYEDEFAVHCAWTDGLLESIPTPVSN